MAPPEHIPSADLPSGKSEMCDYVDGEVFEVLEHIGLAHVRTADGRICGVNRQTEGIQFSKLRDGVRVRCQVTRRFNRVLHAELIV